MGLSKNAIEESEMRSIAGGKNIIKCMIEDNMIKCLVDSGSQVSIINKDKFELLKSEKNIEL